MANVKITDLAAYTDPGSTDVLPIVDVGADVTKKVSIADLLENAGSGTVALPGIAFDGDPDTGIYRPGANQLAISTNGTQALYIDSDGDILVADGNRMEIDEIRARDSAGLKLFDDAGSGIFVEDGGNVGVGTSNPSSPTGRNRFLHIAATTGLESCSIHLEGGDSYSNPSWEFATSYEGPGNSRFLVVNGTDVRIGISSAGNVGIGVGTASSLLHLADAGDITVGTTTGTKIGTATSQKIGFYNATPVVQPTTGVAEAAFVENSGGTAVNVDSTFGGYTIQQVVEALQTLGLLA